MCGYSNRLNIALSTAASVGGHGGGEMRDGGVGGGASGGREATRIYNVRAIVVYVPLCKCERVPTGAVRRRRKFKLLQKFLRTSRCDVTKLMFLHLFVASR